MAASEITAEPKEESTEEGAQDSAGESTGEAREGISLAPPLFIFLEGALVPSGLLWEGLLALIRSHPHLIGLLPWWILGGRARLYREVFRRIALAPEGLAYHEPLLNFLRGEKARGRRLFLVAGEELSLGQRVADHLNLFEAVIPARAPPGEDQAAPGSGKERLGLADRMQAICGDQGFSCAARGGAGERALWEWCQEIVLVNPSRATRKYVRKNTAEWGKPVMILDGRPAVIPMLVRALRIHQWSKNLLLFLPLLTSHRIADPVLLLHGARAFLAFSLCASGAYLLNDLLDLHADRRDAYKRQRPLAAGHLGIAGGLGLMVTSLAGGIALVLYLEPALLPVLSLYLALTVAYSLLLKRVLLLDVVVLASLFTLRIVAGNHTFGIEFSEWLLALSVFFFLSLALVKRYTELRSKQGHSPDTPSSMDSMARRGYRPDDLDMVGTLGVVSGYIAVLVFALYITSERVRVLYRYPDLLWLVCLMLLYWIGRVWLITRRGEMHSDPVVFALRDRVSYIVGAGILAVAALASGRFG